MNNYYRIGVVAGVLSGITWAMNTTLIGFSIKSAILNHPDISHLVPYLSNFLNDIFVFSWMLLAVWVTGKLGVTRHILFSKTGVILIVSGILGGPLGMLFFVLGVKYAGVGYASVISSIYPVLGAIISVYFLKERLFAKNYLGVLLIVLAVCYLSYQTFDNASSNVSLGIAFSFFAALGWAVQAVFLAWAMKGNAVPQHVALLINVGSALFIDLTVLLPSVGAIHLIQPVIFSESGQIAFIAATIGAFSTWLYYVSIHRIGATKTMALDITYGVWAEVFQLFISPAKAGLRLVVAAAVITLGVFMTISRTEDGELNEGSQHDNDSTEDS